MAYAIAKLVSFIVLRLTQPKRVAQPIYERRIEIIMHPELFRIPFTELTVKSYGVMMVIGFIAAIFVIRRLSRDIGQENTEHITTAALYSLIAGIAGARIFYVVHYWQQFSGKGLLEFFAVWKGGLELLGGVFFSIIVIAFYLWKQKLPVRRYLDILAIGLMLALFFGRLGCLLNGCCYGRPTCAFVSIRFPYGSLSYQGQVRPDKARNRQEPYIGLPTEFFGYINEANEWVVAPESDKYDYYLKPFDRLTEQEKSQVTVGEYRPLEVCPTQVYESLSALAGCILLYLHRKNGIEQQKKRKTTSAFFRLGVTFALMFIVYGFIRFFIEFLRDDNPYQANGLTVSQNLSIAMVIVGLLLTWLFAKMKPDKLSVEDLS
ncbi:MAG: prolipoprotein diacylglyceryl transferase [Planctomycetes bacterium]|nr:prolipoprotein diacylglyceryl transferase [Planctomycetota bacterium]MBU1518651.1 prolipoprotein diacylglyceryl transferase [Planctomycetota bacterium]MBU2458129.1 prolipoprotein diacylglyceryl transferase [Planctomycetota bacterium]MBU2597186.1 prolipoprotein diacylglyceryl transferase [Planctomycetota bacterium]